MKRTNLKAFDPFPVQSQSFIFLVKANRKWRETVFVCAYVVRDSRNKTQVAISNNN